MTEKVYVIESSGRTSGNGVTAGISNGNFVVREEVIDLFNAIRVQHGQLTEVVGYDGCGIQHRQRRDRRLDCR